MTKTNKAMLETIIQLTQTPVKDKIDKQLSMFKDLGKKDSLAWFSELCFCILTANSKAKTAIAIQEQLGWKGFLSLNQKELALVIKKNKHRFHNNKSRYIIEARKYAHDIKKIITNIVCNDGLFAARLWLVRNIKGLGFKEASHLLRNVGYSDISILDRHILNLMFNMGIIAYTLNSLTPKTYMEIEKHFFKLASKLNMTPAELDLYMWYIKTGKVLK